MKLTLKYKIRFDKLGISLHHRNGSQNVAVDARTLVGSVLCSVEGVFLFFYADAPPPVVVVVAVNAHNVYVDVGILVVRIPGPNIGHVLFVLFFRGGKYQARK